MIEASKLILKRFHDCERGATGVEYGLIAAFIAIGIIGSVRATGQELAVPFETAATTLNDANN